MQTVTIKNLTKKFGSTVALDNLSLNIEKGKITGLIGADGAGKTTLLRTIIGLLLAENGEIEVLGYNPKTQKDELNLHIGYMPQKFGLYEDLTVLENLKLYAIWRLKIGEMVNYSTKLNNVTLNNWRVFFNEDDYTYIILLLFSLPSGSVSERTPLVFIVFFSPPWWHVMWDFS